jgi:hypothetical protein
VGKDASSQALATAMEKNIGDKMDFYATGEVETSSMVRR